MGESIISSPECGDRTYALLRSGLECVAAAAPIVGCIVIVVVGGGGADAFVAFAGVAECVCNGTDGKVLKVVVA